MTSHSPHPAPEHAAYTSHHLPNAIPNGPHCTEQCSPSFHFQTGMRAAKRHERKSSDRRFSEKREVGPPGTGNHRCGSLLGECATRKVFFQKESGKPNEGLGDEADTHEERTITASRRRRRSTPPRFPPSQRRRYQQQEVHPIIPEGPSPLQRTGGVG